jgi:hypothetical protein
MLEVDILRISPSRVQTPKACSSKKNCSFFIFIQRSLNKNYTCSVLVLLKITIFSAKL